MIKHNLGVSKNTDTPKWFIRVPNPIKMDDLGGFTPIFGNTHLEKTAAFWIRMMISVNSYDKILVKKSHSTILILRTQGDL